MGSGYKTTLVRPDGSTINVDAEDVEQFQALGYKPEDTESLYSRQIEKGREEYFTSPEQKVITGIQGFMSGLTVGASDYYGMDEDTRDRARYNPGTRLATELAGALAPAVLAPGTLAGQAARLTPAGLVARGAEAAAGSLAKGRIGQGAVRAAIEGGVASAGAEITNARLNGDPITAEAIVAGVGWGSLFGGALGAAAGKLGVYSDALVAERRVAAKGTALVPAERWGAFRGAIDDARKVAGSTLDDVAKTAKEAPGELIEQIVRHAEDTEAAQKALISQIDAKGGWAAKGARELKGEMMKLRRQVAAAAGEKGNYTKFEELTGRHSEVMGKLASLTGVTVPEIQPFVMNAQKAGGAALDEIKGLKAVKETLDHFPTTAEGFAAMTPAKMEKQAAAIDHFIKNGSAELTGVKDAVKQQIEEMVASAGLTMEKATSPGQQLRSAWEAMRSAAKQSAKAEGLAKAIVKKGMAVATARSMLGASSRIVGGLLDLKGAVLGTITNSVRTWGPGAAKVGAKLAPRVDPLRVRLDGTVDGAKQSRKHLMEARAKEIREAAPAVRDSLYRAVEPLVGNHTEAASAMHKVAVAQFDALMARLPRDPATAFANMRSLWKPDFIETERFARAYEVFQNPVAVAVRWLKDPKSVTPEGAQALREMNPELWTHLRVEMLQRLAEPEVLDKLNYNEQVSLGRMLEITVHSTQDPRFIKAQQEMFSKRSAEPLPARPSASGNNSNNPSGTSRGLTSAQRITDH